MVASPTVMRMRAADVAAAVGGDMIGPDVEVDGVAIDSRTVRGRPLFVPVVAERDGHDFIATALAAGAPAYLTSQGRAAPGRGDGTAILVADTTRALLDVGRLARRRLPDRVVGITGSVGKTSTKDLLVGVLRGHRRAAASERSFNNELGVPLTLANAADDAEVVVVEMGARGPGHIALLCDAARPTIGVVTAVGDAHLELFGSIEKVAAAKSELVAALPTSGTAVLNADDELVAAMASRTPADVIRFGVTGGEVRAEGVKLDGELRASFQLVTDWGRAPVRLAVHGRHHVTNALAAAAAGLACGLNTAQVAEGLAGAELSAMRMAWRRSPMGATVIDDAYNANPTSTRAALASLAELPARRRVAVLGVMAELGQESGRFHQAVAREAAAAGIGLITVDAPAYGVGGADAVSQPEEAVERLGPLGEGDAVLVKGSRVAGLERVVALLLDRSP